MAENIKPRGASWRGDFQATLPSDPQRLQAAITAKQTESGLLVPVKSVLVAQPLGFCAGVERAITALSIMVDMYPGEPVYCRNIIVHNEKVQGYFEGRGVRFFTDFDEVPEGAPIMLSAHGSSAETLATAREKAGDAPVVDAACPLVTKVHREVERAKTPIVYVGHPGHEEAEEVRKEDPDRVHIVQTPADVAALAERLGEGREVTLLMQTTLAQKDWELVDQALKGTSLHVNRPGKSDVCFATTNRQAGLRRMIENGAEAVLVVTSRTSSNGKALGRVALEAGAKAFIVEDPSEIPAGEIEGTTVGITAAASAPGEQILATMSRLNPRNGVHFVSGVQETESFPHLPDGLRKR